MSWTGLDHRDTNSWQRSASRAAHPSSLPELLGPGDLLREIAAGLGGVTLPHGLRDSAPATLTRDLVLTSPAYDVWVMHWPAGEVADLHQHDHFVAFHVVLGGLAEERVGLDGTQVTELHTGDTAVVPPHTPHRVRSLRATTTVHVHATNR